jgi:hypothetical protein
MGHAELMSVFEKLPPERQAEVLDFAEFLAARSVATAEASCIRPPTDIGRILAEARAAWPFKLSIEDIDKKGSVEFRVG